MEDEWLGNVKIVFMEHFRDRIMLNITDAIHIDEQRPAINLKNSNFDRTEKLVNWY